MAMLVYRSVPSMNIATENGWLEYYLIVSFWDKRPIFRCKLLLVSGRLMLLTDYHSLSIRLISESLISEWVAQLPRFLLRETWRSQKSWRNPGPEVPRLNQPFSRNANGVNWRPLCYALANGECLGLSDKMRFVWCGGVLVVLFFFLLLLLLLLSLVALEFLHIFLLILMNKFISRNVFLNKHNQWRSRWDPFSNSICYWFFSLCFFLGFTKPPTRIHGTSKGWIYLYMNVVDFYATSGKHFGKVFPVWISEKNIGSYPSPRMFSSKWRRFFGNSLLKKKL